MPATPTPVTSYPASDPGFAAVPVEDLLAGEADLIARIKLCYGIDRDGFERDVLSGRIWAGSRWRGLPGACTKPTASAPAPIAAATDSAVLRPHTFTYSGLCGVIWQV